MNGQLGSRFEEGLVHLYKNNGYNIVLDINSGSVHVVDDLVYDIVEALDQGQEKETVIERLSSMYGRQEVRDGYAECESLIADEKL